MANLFSVFDPSSFMGMPLNWLISLALVATVPMSYWMAKTQFSFIMLTLLKLINKEFQAIMGPIRPGSTFLVISLFLFLLLTNSLGLLPYVFTSSSHLVFSVSVALPLWAGHVIYSSFKQPNFMLAHLVPLGTPYALMPFMVIIELVSSLIRPLTLSVRLAANLVAGHLLLTLLSTGAPFMPFSVLTGILAALILLGILESAVAIIQAYVFSILSTLYINEVNSKNLW